ncbi:hypothetical protein [Acidovorax sp. Root219]|uniref:hypothetical protein n=1 Tax=Acidovorax sp. Root219 TaxID=1736493 RepID=UPI00070F2938|nr:hypothetical protein [Acidovorax sp. Root219]KRC36241.1 hypothetical protein ASE28_01520 [Acidovorax sp. Root219]
MSFFANLLGGTLQGVGSGMSAMAADEERLASQRALMQERQQGALDLQRQRAEDKLMQQEQMMQMRSELGGGAGGGGGGKGINLAALAMQAKTPEEQDRVVAATRTFHGDNAADRMADKMFNRPRMVGVAATPGDFARYDRAGDMEAAPPTTTLERARYDADKGTQALQRAYTAFLDPAKLDDHAKAERQFGLNDLGTANAAQVMQRGGSLPEASGAFQKYSGTKDESGKEDLAQQRIDATRERTAATVTNAGANRQAQDARALDRQIAGAYKQLGEARPKDKPALQTRIQEMESRRDAMDGAALAPALNDYQPGATAKAPSPTTVLPKPRSPAEAAKAFQYQPGSFLKKP